MDAVSTAPIVPIVLAWRRAEPRCVDVLQLLYRRWTEGRSVYL